MNTFKRILIVLAVIAGTFFVFTGPAEARVPGYRCHSQRVIDHPNGWLAKQCRRQGWFIDVGYTYDGVRYALIVGPQGRVWVDTLGQLGNVR